MPETIIKEILSSLYHSTSLTTLTVTDIRIGIRYTGVMLENGSIGVCYTPLKEVTCCQTHDKTGNLTGNTALDLAELAQSWKIQERIIGIATINALSQNVYKTNTSYFMKEGNLLDQIRIKRNDTVALIGYIRPYKSKIKNITNNLFILDRRWSITGNNHVFPDTASEEIIPKADIVLITGSAMLYGSIDRLLELSKYAREVGIVGPTASMIPDPLFKRGATIIGGINITNPLKLLQIISEGGGVHQFKAYATKNIVRPKVP
jgi:uncharacterized protein (DUF4213/DUF364 family)